MENDTIAYIGICMIIMVHIIVYVKIVNINILKN